MILRKAAIASVHLLGLSIAQPATANVFDVFGAGARSQSMGGAIGALTNDYMAAFHNPAGLGNAASTFGMSVFGSFNRTAIRLTPRPAGYNPPNYSERLRSRSDTVNPDGTSGVAVGGTFRLLGDNLSLGGVIFAPFDGFGTSSSHFADEREQYFSNQLHYELMGERLSTEVMAFGMSYRLRPWLSMGIGMLILPGAVTSAPVYVRNAADLSQVDINIAVDQKARRALTAGVIVRPAESLRIGLTFQDEIWFAVGGQAMVQLRGEEAQGTVIQEINVISGYSPTRVSGSLAWVHEVATVSLEGTYRVWSRYLDNHGALAGFDDTIDVKVGLELPMSPGTFARAGLGWAPSPVPAQTGRTNYVDNDRIAVGFGAGSDVELWDLALTIDVGFQVQALIADQVTKSQGTNPDCADGVRRLCDEFADLERDTPLTQARDTVGLQSGNPGFPGYSHGGYVVAASIDVKWKF